MSNAEALAKEIADMVLNGFRDAELDAIRAMDARLTIIERLCGYAEHDADCENNGAYPGSCTCGLSRLIGEIRGDD